jgi:tetratricopeptide (TPR) repeat protein
MRTQVKTPFSLLAAAMLAAGSFAGVMHNAVAQRAGAEEEEAQSGAPTMGTAAATAMNEAIELLNMGNYAGAKERIATLRLDRLSPYERSTVEKILFSIEYAEEDFDAARGHLQASIDAGGLNELQISEARYQYAQLFMTEERWREGAAALEEWFKTAVNPNSAAYYLLSVAYYQMEDFAKALPPAEKAVEIMEQPQESWVSLLLALYMQSDEYRKAIPVLERLIAMVPDKKTYWMNLSSIYTQIEDYPKALAVMQVAYSAGLVTEDSEIRRLADLLTFNDVPYRGATVLEKAIADKTVTVDDKLYEKLANCWIAAGEYDRSIPPLERAAELAANGELFVRLGEVNVQREDWEAAVGALQRGMDKGQLRDTAKAQLLMGVALMSQKKYSEAREWFVRARSSEQHRNQATGFIQYIDSQA